MVAIFSDANRARMRYALESDTTWGTIPASGITRELRFTGSTISPQKTTAVSDEIRADRMISDIVQVAVKTTGDISVEFSAGSHDELLQAFAYGLWTRPMTFDSVKGTSLAFTGATTLVVSGVDVTLQFLNTRKVRTHGFVNAANNDYWTVNGAPSFSGGNTTITLSGGTAVAEAGTIYSRLFDANDVIVLKSTAIRSGTAAASTFDSNGGNLFTAAIGAGQLVVGQKIYVEGLGYERGTVTFSTILPTAPSVISVSDNTTTWNFQFAGALPATGNFVSVAGSATAATQAASFVTAINTLYVAGQINCSASAVAGVVTIKNNNESGGAIVEVSDTANDFTVVNFSGGNSTANGVFTLTGVANDTLTVTPAPPTINNTTIAVTVKGSMLRNPATSGTITPHSLSIETLFEDVSQCFVTNGHRVGGFTYDFASGALVKGSFTTQGSATTRFTATKFGNTGNYSVLPTTSTPIANAANNVGAVLLNNAALTTAIQSISIKATNNLRDQMAIGSISPQGIGAGRMEITGSVSAYFADGSLWDKFINHNTLALTFATTDPESHYYSWILPAVIFDTDALSPTGKDTDVMETISFTAKRDVSTSCMFQIDRFSCILPTGATT